MKRILILLSFIIICFGCNIKPMTPEEKAKFEAKYASHYGPIKTGKAVMTDYYVPGTAKKRRRHSSTIELYLVDYGSKHTISIGRRNRPTLNIGDTIMVKYQIDSVNKEIKLLVDGSDYGR